MNLCKSEGYKDNWFKMSYEFTIKNSNDVWISHEEISECLFVYCLRTKIIIFTSVEPSDSTHKIENKWHDILDMANWIIYHLYFQKIFVEFQTL